MEKRQIRYTVSYTSEVSGETRFVARLKTLVEARELMSRMAEHDLRIWMVISDFIEIE
jgi:hypothetical protein